MKISLVSEREKEQQIDNELAKITLETKKIRGRNYGAKIITIRLFGAFIDCVAVVAGTKKWASSKKDATRFLTKNGLTRLEAEMLVEVCLARQALRLILDVEPADLRTDAGKLARQAMGDEEI